MRTDSGRGRLYDAHLQLQHRWDDVEVHWNDSVRADFEEKIYVPLDQMTGDVLRAIDRLSQIFGQCRRECTGERSLGELLS